MVRSVGTSALASPRAIRPTKPRDFGERAFSSALISLDPPGGTRDDRSARPEMAPSDWHARAINNVANDRRGRPELTGLKKRLTQYSVGQDRHGQRFDVVRNDEISARDQGQALGRPVQRQRPASAHADVQGLASRGQVNDVQQVLRDGVSDPDLSHSLLK